MMDLVFSLRFSAVDRISHVLGENGLLNSQVLLTDAKLSYSSKDPGLVYRAGKTS